MSGYTVKQVAKLSGVSVRTLHHYDEVGLLKPACVGANGYRYYGREELLRLQQILFHRELGFSLEEIGRVLDAGDFDRVAALKAHRTKLEAERKRYGKLIRTIDDTLAALEGATTMDDKAMYKGFDPEKQAEYDAWIVDRYGEPGKKAIEASRALHATWSQADFDASEAEIKSIEEGYAAALKSGLPADCTTVQDLTRRLHGWVSHSWTEPLNQAAFASLGHQYEEHPVFRERYEAKAVGLTEYLATAVRVFAERELA